MTNPDQSYVMKYVPFDMLRCFNPELAWKRAREIMEKNMIRGDGE